jgi:hypothetical protein
MGGTLICEECGCSCDDEARGWTGLLAEDIDGIEPTSVATFWPDCAAEEFAYSAGSERADEQT